MNADLLAQTRQLEPREVLRLSQRVQALQRFQRSPLVALLHGYAGEHPIGEDDHVSDADSLNDVEAIRKQGLRSGQLAAVVEGGCERRGVQGRDSAPPARFSLSLIER